MMVMVVVAATVSAQVHAGGVDGVGQNAALAAVNGPFLLGVVAADWPVPALDANEAALAPIGTPAILDEPVLHAVRLSVADQHDVMVHDHVVVIAAVKDASLIVVPVLRGINTHGDWSHGGHCLHQGTRIVRLHLDIAGDASHWRDAMTQQASARMAGAGADKRVAPRVCDTALDHGSEGVLQRAPRVARVAAAVGAVRDCLLGDVDARLCRQEDVALQSGGRGNGPASAALSLVLDRPRGPPPVHGLWQQPEAPQAGAHLRQVALRRRVTRL
mmetsp:Transcript_62315/g.166611  ORF Transcript_62315/g.166611 Transcript_62315/m.166611 type:complete len:273 (-) Transcript_62315:450-1268(-)